MPAPLRVKLNRLEEETLRELQKASSVPYRTRNRAMMLKLNAQGKNAPEIAQIFNCHEHTVRAAIQRWQERGLVGLWSAAGRGAKPKWKAEDIEYIETCLEEEERTYNSIQLARKLQEERAVDLSSDRLRRILKKKISLEKNQTQQQEKAK
jgi:transposase